jgi:RecA/RadA recombinase
VVADTGVVVGAEVVELVGTVVDIVVNAVVGVVDVVDDVVFDVAQEASTKVVANSKLKPSHKIFFFIYFSSFIFPLCFPL